MNESSPYYLLTFLLMWISLKDIQLTREVVLKSNPGVKLNIIWMSVWLLRSIEKDYPKYQDINHKDWMDATFKLLGTCLKGWNLDEEFNEENLKVFIESVEITDIQDLTEKIMWQEDKKKA